MPDLVARGALQADGGGPLRHGDARTVAAEVLPLITMIDVRVAPDDGPARNAFAAASGITLSQQAGGPASVAHAAKESNRYALWLGPDEWLVIAPGHDAGLADTLMRALAGLRASAVDVSDLRAAFRLTGPAAREVLAKGCGIDLHPRAFPVGTSVVTQFARVRALVHLREPQPAFDLYFERTVAEYAWRWLTDAMLEFTM